MVSALSGKEPVISSGSESQYWRGDKTWQTLDKSVIGLGSVENTALSTWTGSSNLTNVGTITSGTWSGSSIAVEKGGTGASSATEARNNILPSQTSQAGKFLTTDGSGNVSWGTPPATEIAWGDIDGVISNQADLASALAGKEPAISAGTVDQYFRGDKTWQTLPTIPTRSFNNAPGRTIVTGTGATGFQPSSSRDTMVSYSVTITSAVQIGLVTNVEGYVVLEIAPTNSATAGHWVEIARVANGQQIGLALAFSSTQKVGGTLTGIVPAGYFAKVRSVNVNSTPTYILNSGQEVAL